MAKVDEGYIQDTGRIYCTGSVGNRHNLVAFKSAFEGVGGNGDIYFITHSDLFFSQVVQVMNNSRAVSQPSNLQSLLQLSAQLTEYLLTANLMFHSA